MRLCCCVFWVGFLGAMLSFQGLTQAAKTSDGIMVWKLELKSGVTKEDIDSISGYITAQVERFSGKRAVSDADIHTILKGEETKQRCGTDGTSCIAEIGSALGVPEAVSGDLGRMGDYWILNLRRINVRNAEVMGRVGKQIRGDVNALIEALPGAVAELFGKEAPPVVAPVAPVTYVEPTQEPKEEPTEAQAEPSVEQENPKPPMSVLCKAAYGTFFSGMALLALGGVGQWQMNQALDDYDYGDTGAKSAHSMWKGISATGYALGGAAAATGIALWIVDAVKKPSATNTDAQTEAVTGITPLAGGASFQLQVQW